MIDRYIYAVVRELPENSRTEIAAEIRSMIDELLDGVDGSLTLDEKIEQVLRELGDPGKLADRYRGRERYLIGPRYFDKYVFVLKIVLLSVFIGISVVSGLGLLFSGESILEIVVSYLGTLVSVLLQAAAWVTVVFTILEYNEVSLDPAEDRRDWEPSQLPVLPHEKALIARGETVFSIMVSAIALPLLILFADKIGIYYKAGSAINFIPLFQPDGIRPFKVILFAVFALNILVELIKLVKGRWTLNMAAVTSVFNVVSAGLIIGLLNNQKIWNPEITAKFQQYLPISFERAILTVTVVIILITAGEIGAALYKALRYGEGSPESKR